MGDCKPLGFLIGLPFALLSLVLSIVGAIIWIIGTLLTIVCPCCVCFAWLANTAMDLIQLPVSVIQCFVDLIPC
ncbi:signaling peptide TAXIMIN 2-like [Typha angustifolia]|uniref:signaling peptide TAXIMIN 2-like n=1 Tax=Typha angustifolia TaxID=59011 RepID=UPI003C2B8FDA